MSQTNLAAILSALPQNFDKKMSTLWNRRAVSLSQLSVEYGHGQNCAFIVNVGGQQAYSFADGYDVQDAEFGSDAKLPAVLSWGQTRSSFNLTQRAVDAAASSTGGAQELVNLFMQGLYESTTSIVSSLNAQFDSGSGAGDTLVGFQNAILSTGTYAGINVASYPLFKGNRTAVGGALTYDVLASMETKIFNSCGLTPDLITMPPDLHQKYAGTLFTSMMHVQGVSNGKPQDQGVPSDMVFWKGIPVIRDKDQASGTVRFINKDHVKLRVLPPVQSKDSVVYNVQMANDGFQGLSLPLIVESLAKTGPSAKFTVRTPSLQVVVDRPNAHGLCTGVT